ncbi:MAG: hypothetical protein ACFFDN_33705 [Candidatus Hodarchaeota archaeon]
MDPSIDWLMGFLEAKSSFTISHQKYKVIKKRYTKRYIKSLKKEDLFQEIKEIIMADILSFENIPKTLSYLDEISKFSTRKLRNFLKKLLDLKSIEREKYDSIPRPAFYLTLRKEDELIINKIKMFFNQSGIKSNGPYLTNKEANLRLEIKGINDCLKLYELLSEQKWYTSKRGNFEKWGKEILDISTNKEI